MIKLDTNEKALEFGLNISVAIDFVRDKENPNKMNLLQCTFTHGCRSVDYVFVADKTNLLDIIKEFINDYE